MYLEDHNHRGAVALNDLPARTAADATGSIAFTDGTDYTNYETRIDNALYNVNQLNNFVEEITTKIHQQRQG